MARKKISILSISDKLTVQKSTPLLSLWRSDLTLAEFKILDMYLARINSHNPEKRTVTFEKGELEQILGVKRIRIEELDARLLHLGTPIRIDDDTIPNDKFTRISLFEQAIAERDEDGIWKVDLTASQTAMKYFFNVEDIGYLRYKLRCITSLTSRYSYIMFLYLERNRSLKKMSWEIPVDSLKEILSCDTEPNYKDFRRFNDKVLKRVQFELNQKTECKYSYTSIKHGRTVIAIHFDLKTLPRLDVETVEVDSETKVAPEINIPSWEQLLSEWNLSKDKLEELAALLATIPESKLPEADDVEQAKYKYIALKAAEIKRRSQEEKRINNRFGYLKKMIDADMHKSQPVAEQKSNTYVPTGTQAFRNFKERTDNNYMDKAMKPYRQQAHESKQSRG